MKQKLIIIFGNLGLVFINMASVNRYKNTKPPYLTKGVISTGIGSRFVNDNNPTNPIRRLDITCATKQER
jgi:hypothetical protein